jgi:hypothetical protein
VQDGKSGKVERGRCQERGCHVAAGESRNANEKSGVDGPIVHEDVSEREAAEDHAIMDRLLIPGHELGEGEE